jgi:hypothetical protein
VLGISGDYFRGAQNRPTTSYTFSRYLHVWGWATWRRAWRLNDPMMSEWERLRRTRWLLEVGDGHRDFDRYWREQFDAVTRQRLDTWDYGWTYSAWLHGGLFIAPAYNLVTNIGFGVDATHTTDHDALISPPELEPMPFPLMHPQVVSRDREGDRWEDLNLYGTRTSLRRLLMPVPGAYPTARRAHGMLRRGR